ncbi:hypothetical protein D3C76_1223930 [compost metagenome]
MQQSTQPERVIGFSCTRLSHDHDDEADIEDDQAGKQHPFYFQGVNEGGQQRIADGEAEIGNAQNPPNQRC